MTEVDHNISPSDIVIFHVGGGVGGYGPIDHVLKAFPEKCVLFDFEADTPDNLPVITGKVRVHRINACIGKETEQHNFHVNKHRDSSSMLPPASRALKEHLGIFVNIFEVATWEQNTEEEKIITIDTTSLSDIMHSMNIIPDVLSIDAQGMEYDILKGCAEKLHQINSIVTEVEFFEIYKGQGLFSDQMSLLLEHNIRLMEIINFQRWHPGPVIGEGFTTVGEAIWFRCLDDFFKRCNEDNVLEGIKLAAMAYSYSRYSYAYMILCELRKAGHNVHKLCNSSRYEKLATLLYLVDNELPGYSTNKNHLVEKVKI